MNRCLNPHHLRTREIMSSSFTSKENQISSHIEITKANLYQSQHINQQRWRSNSYDATIPTVPKHRQEYAFSSLSSITDHPLRCPSRRQSLDSNTSSISSNTSSRESKRILNNNECKHVPIRPPMYISFESHLYDTVTVNQENRNEKDHNTPPKCPKRITSMDDIRNNNNQCIDIDVVSSNAIASFTTKLSSMQPK